MATTTSREKTLETLGILSLASVVAGLVFRLEPCYFLAIGLLFTGIFLKRPAEMIASAWMKFARLVGAVNTRILLAVSFYLVLTPVALMYRLFHGDFLHIGRGRGETSLWHVRDHTYTEKDFENMWR